MNELINTLEKAKAQGRRIILDETEDFVATVCIQKEYAEYYLDGMLTFVEDSECEYNTGANATSPDVVLDSDKDVFTFNLCQDCLEKF